MRHPLPRSTFLVTGGGSGIGRLLSLRAADEGAHVVIWDLSASAGESVREEIRARGGRADSCAIDATDREAVKTAAEVVGPVDILVNNAGVVTGKRLLDATGIDSLVACPFYIDTGMFEGVRTKVPRLLPILDQNYAASRILTAEVQPTAEQTAR